MILQNREESELKRIVSQFRSALNLQHDVRLTDADIITAAMNTLQHKVDTLVTLQMDIFSIPELIKILKLFNYQTTERVHSPSDTEAKPTKNKPKHKGH